MQGHLTELYRRFSPAVSRRAVAMLQDPEEAHETARLEPQTAQQIEEVMPEALPAGEEQLRHSYFGGRTLEGYRDPVTNDPGPWLAAFAPVGHTGFAVIVQTHESAVMASAQLTLRIVWWCLPFALAVALVWWSRYRSFAAQEAQEAREAQGGNPRSPGTASS